MAVAMGTGMSVWSFCVLVLFHACVISVRASPRSIRIGGLFEPEHESLALALEYAVDRVNSRRDLLPSTRLLVDVQRTTAGDSFGVSKKLCRQIKDGVAAIFGPMSGYPAAHVQSICDTMEIPHIETRWDFQENTDFFIVNLYPHYLSMSQAYVDYVKHLQWTSFIILYEHDDGLIRLQELLKAPTDYNFEISVQKLQADNDDYRPLLKRLKKLGRTRMVLDCSYKTLRQALSINMMTPYYHYMLTTLDVSLVDLDDFKYGGANITAFQLIDPTRQQVIDVTNDWILGRVRTGSSPLEEEKGMRTHTALVYDAVFLFAKALTELMRAQDVTASHLSCNRVKPWTEIEGLTGTVKFDNEGRRSDFHLDVVGLHSDGLEKEDGYDSTNPNDRFEGFCVDLLAEISNVLHFNYSIHLVADGHYVREQVIDFTKPFMNLGISILFKRPEKTNPSLFSFLAPLSFEIWIYVVAAYLGVSFMLFVLARFTPYEVV
ncbi:hypothetical protein NP493_103g02008 [Ridgeia piscesae]|uniref:Uncharacterized protein n=1 Tax=Ridgeia piscesae TaxID=27915 RepID=A0AAD9P7D1_RIDPI|nr:hypothetical protein NP493_103g02008 [Ridgeia piscesae]